MSARIGWPAVVRQAWEIAGRRGHDLLIMLRVLLLGALAMIAQLSPARLTRCASGSGTPARTRRRP